ncbi:hypothetical protein [Pelagibacterium lacus]|uniref:DUF2946 domain-containing protein n=1 Tax=Pelagibacterium lacus TaxID=2282655 RepID=A0A369W705_9HYPH|nr:hypothetical protein [Pelagibacterium lacus]RDE10474.1 hypothetical protein DVH29_00540 [Pelagibacterium lacus]
MKMWRDIAGEVIKALAVLALIFLSFAHQPIEVPQADGDAFSFQLADLSYCGGAPDGDGGGHVPCHACRSGDIDLPPAPSIAEPARHEVVAAVFTVADTAVADQFGYLSSPPRAPPALA